MERQREGNAPGGTQANLDRLLLWHLWACVPFALLWVLWPSVFGRPRGGEEIASMRILYISFGGTLAVRTWIAYRNIRGLPWGFVWPLVDVAFITIGARIGYASPDSWIIALYLLPVIQAAATLDLRWALFVAALSAASLGFVDGFENLKYSYFAFRLFFLILSASLFTQLAQRLAKAREELALADYRNELAVEMHDGLQQYLGAIAMRLEYAESLVEADPKSAAKLAVEQKGSARQAADELRLMVHRLRSPHVGKGSLESALQYPVALFIERTQIPAKLEIVGNEEALQPRVEHALLRIVQEALTNVAKHAQAKSASVKLAFEPGWVVCRIEDDGAGLPVGVTSGSDQAGLSGGIGLDSMRHRAEALGGSVSVSSQPGSGTVVEARLPL